MLTYADAGVTGQALLESTLVDLECGLEIDDEKARTKVWRGLETLRATARYESAARLERETRCLITLKVHTSAYVTEYVSIRQHAYSARECSAPREGDPLTYADVC